MPLSILAAAVLAVIVWGASPVAAKIAVAELSPFAVAVLRTVLGGLAALPVALYLRIPLPGTREQRSLLLLSGFCGFLGFPLLFTVGVSLTSANHASMVLASLPVFTGAIAMSWDRVAPTRFWWIGCGVALVGELILISTRSSGAHGSASVAGDLTVLASNLFASLGYVAGGRLQRAGYPSTATTFWGVVIFAAVLLPATPFLLWEVELSRVPLSAWMAIAYLAVGVTIIGYVLWYWALGKGGIARMGLIQFLQPVSGVLLAAALLGERITPGFIAASVVVLIGVWLAMKSR